MNKCFFNEEYDCSMYDCTREEYQVMVESNMKLRIENNALQERIDKAIEYIEKRYSMPTENDLHLINKIDQRNLLKILKGKNKGVDRL